MARTKSESYQQLDLKDDEQSVGAAADAPHAPPMSSAVVVPDPLATRLNKLPNAIIKFKFCRSFNESAFSDKPGYLDDSDIIALSRVSKATHGFFRPYQLQILADKLLLKVMSGNQTEAEDILKKRPDLLEIKGTATDYSGRMFHCTAFQYALWALDTRYMCQMMLDCLPYSLEGERIKEALLLQFFEQESVGIKYQFVGTDIKLPECVKNKLDILNGDIVKQKHYDFTLLLGSLRLYADNCVGWIAAGNYDAILNQAAHIGFHQRFVPAHVAQHYCDPDVPFYPTPTFTKPTFTRHLSCNNYRLSRLENWFSPNFFAHNGEIGLPIGILRGRLCEPTGTFCFGAVDSYINWDLVALFTLSQTRTKDLELLKERLQSPIPKPKPKTESVCLIC